MMDSKGFDEQLFDEFFGAQPQAIIWLEAVWDERKENVIDFHYVYTNDEGLKYLGVPKSEVSSLYVSSSRTINPELRTQLMAEMKAVFLSGRQSESQVYNAALNKFARSLRIKFRGGVLSILQDVSEEKSIIANLEREKAFSNSILYASPDGIFAAEARRNEQGEILDFIFREINPAFTRIMGLKKEDVIGKGFVELFPASKDNIFQLHRRVCETGKPETQEMLYQHESFSVWYYISVVKLNDGILVTFSDITQQKKNSELVEQNRNLLASIMDHSPAGISVTEVIRDAQGKVVDGRTIISNDIAVAFTGIHKDDYLNKTINEVDPNIIKSPLYQQALHTLATGEPFHTQYFFEPTRRWMELSVSRMDENRLINIFMDITDLKESQLRLEHSLHDLRRSNENLEEFAYAASHDLKEPIRKVLMFADILRVQLKAKATEEEQVILDKIEKATHRMKVLVDDLLLYSRVSQELPLEEDVDLNNKLRLVQEDLELLIRDKGAVIHAGHLPTVRGHRRQIQQVFTNLITNALKYSRPGVPPEIWITSEEVQGSSINLSLSPEEQQQAFHHISIRDNGMGFEQADAEKIFNVFTRLHGNTEGGTGVGLTIVRKVIANHHGYITAEGRPGEGAVFHVYLPKEF